MGTKLHDRELEKAAEDFVSCYSDKINELNRLMPPLGTSIGELLKNAFVEGVKRGVMLVQYPAKDIQ